MSERIEHLLEIFHDNPRMLDWLIRNECPKFRFKPKKRTPRGPVENELRRQDAMEVTEARVHRGALKVSKTKGKGAQDAAGNFDFVGKGTDYGIDDSGKPRWRRSLPTLEVYEEWCEWGTLTPKPRRKVVEPYVSPFSLLSDW